MTIKFKRSINKGFKPTPAELQEGELAIGLADKSLFTKDHKGEIIKLGGAGGVSDGDLVNTLKSQDDDFWYIPFGTAIPYDSAPPTTRRYLNHRVDFGISTIPAGNEFDWFYVNPITGKGALVQRSAVGTSGSCYFYYTTDWGRSWKVAASGSTYKNYSNWGIVLINPTGTKISVCGATQYALSTNMGANWSHQNVTRNAKIDQAGWYNDIKWYATNRQVPSFQPALAFDDNRAIAIADAGNSGQFARIFYTSDFGKNWKSAADSPWMTITGFAIQEGGTVGYIASAPSGNNPQLMKTTNSGQTWTSVGNLPVPTSAVSYVRLGCTKEGRLFMAYTHSVSDVVIYSSDDQGATWKVNLYYDDYVGTKGIALNFTSSDNTIAFGSMISYDNGETWERNILMDNTNEFNGFFVPNSKGKRVYYDVKKSGSVAANLFVEGKYQNYGNGWYSHVMGSDQAARLALAKSV